MNNKKIIKNLAIYLGIPIVVLFIIFFMFGKSQTSTQGLVYSDVLNYFETEQVKAYKLDLGTGEMVITLNDEKSTKYGYEVPNISLFYEDVSEYIDLYNEHNPNNKMVQDVRRPVETSWLVSMLPTIVMLVVVIALFYFMSRKQKKEEKALQEMKDSIKIGDEITTIGGIVGRVVNVKEETIVIETTKDRTKIRFLKSAVKSVDVKAEDAE